MWSGGCPSSGGRGQNSKNEDRCITSIGSMCGARCLLLAQRYGQSGARVVADCAAVITGYNKWKAGQGQGMEYRNPYGGIWSQMSAIQKERGLGVIVQEMTKVRAHQTKSQAEAAGEGHLHAGNEKTDEEAGPAAGAMDARERVAYRKVWKTGSKG